MALTKRTPGMPADAPTPGNLHPSLASPSTPMMGVPAATEAEVDATNPSPLVDPFAYLPPAYLSTLARDRRRG